MLNKLRDTVKHTFIYSIGNLSTKVIGLLLLPLYTTKLSLLNYGRFTILETTSMFLTMVLGLRIVSSMMRWSAETEDKIEQGKITTESEAIFQGANATQSAVLGELAVVELNKNKTRTSAIINAIRTAPVVPGDGGASFKASMIAQLSTLISEDYSNILSDKVKNE